MSRKERRYSYDPFGLKSNPDPFGLKRKPLKISNSSFKIPSTKLPENNSIFGGNLNPQTTTYRRLASNNAPRITRYERVIKRNQEPLIDIPKIVKKAVQNLRQPQQQQNTLGNTLSLLEKLRRLDELAQQPRRDEKLNQVYEELANFRKELESHRQRADEEAKSLHGKIDEIKQIQLKLLKTLINSGIRDVSTTVSQGNLFMQLAEEIERLEKELGTFKNKWEPYEPDVKHLHRQNQDEASDIAHG